MIQLYSHDAERRLSFYGAINPIDPDRQPMKKANTEMREGGRRLDLTRRIIQMLKLLQTGEPVYKQDLIHLFQVDRKTINRYIGCLMEFYDIQEEKDGRRTRYTMISEKVHTTRKRKRA